MRRHIAFGVLFCSILCVLAAMMGVAGATATDSSVEQVKGEFTDGRSAEGSIQTNNETRIAVFLNGTRLPAGGERTTGDKPNLRVSVSAPTTIEAISVRIDGTTRRTYFPNATSFSKPMTLNTRGGKHALTIIVESTTTASYNATLIRDAAAPRIQFDSPFTTNVPESPPDEYVTRTSQVVMGGSLYDRSDIEYIEFRPKYYTGSGSDERFETRRTVRIEDPGTQFNETVRLIYFAQQKRITNLIQIRVADTYGHIRTYSINFDILDNRQPTVDVQKLTPVFEHGAVEVTFTVQDAVGIENVLLQSNSVEKAGNNYLYRRPAATTAPAPRELTFTERIRVVDSSGRIEIAVEDRAGNTNRYVERFNSSELIRPKIRINRSTYRSSERTVSVTGAVYDGQVSSVRVETVAADGKVIESQTVFGGGIKTSVPIDATVSTSPSFEAVVVRAVDSSGVEHTQRLSIAGIKGVGAEGSRPSPRSETQTPSEETMVPTTTTSQPPTMTTSTTSAAATGSIVDSILSLPVFKIMGVVIALAAVSAYAVYKLTRV
jgi:hypothetical protein